MERMIEMTGRGAVLPLNEAEFENTVRAEEMPHTYNCLGRTITNPWKICAIIIGIVAFFFLLILILANYAWDWGKLRIENVGIQSLYADINISSPSLATIKANCSLLPAFRAPGGITHPVLGDLTMGIYGKRYQNIKIPCDGTFQTIGNEELVMVTCEPTQISLRKEDMMMLNKLMGQENLWMQVTGSFKWHLENRNPLIWNEIKGRARFVCQMPYHDSLSGECSPL